MGGIVLERILVELYIPAMQGTYDVYIPTKVKFYEVRVLLIRILGELLEGYFIPSKDMRIYERETGNPIDLNQTANELGLLNGIKLMVI